jgi:hypothetical protein
LQQTLGRTAAELSAGTQWQSTVGVGGRWNGVRLLSRKSVEPMTDNAIGNLNLANFSEMGLTLVQNLRVTVSG